VNRIIIFLNLLQQGVGKRAAIAADIVADAVADAVVNAVADAVADVVAVETTSIYCIFHKCKILFFL